MNLDALQAVRRTGTEPFHEGGREQGFNLLSFWQWACSDLNGNALRGLIAEYLVARAVGAHEGVRTEWDAYDVLAPDGTKIEVKTSAYLQSWKQNRLSDIRFDIAPKRSWDAASNTMAEKPSRPSDIYVFAIHALKDKARLDPLDVSQWEFHVLPTKVLDEKVPEQKTISLSSLLKLGPRKVNFEGLGESVRAATA